MSSFSLQPSGQARRYLVDPGSCHWPASRRWLAVTRWPPDGPAPPQAASMSGASPGQPRNGRLAAARRPPRGAAREPDSRSSGRMVDPPAPRAGSEQYHKQSRPFARRPAGTALHRGRGDPEGNASKDKEMREPGRRAADLPERSAPNRDAGAAPSRRERIRAAYRRRHSARIRLRSPRPWGIVCSYRIRPGGGHHQLPAGGQLRHEHDRGPGH